MGSAMLRRRSALVGVRMRRSGMVRAVQERVKRAGTSVEVALGKWYGSSSSTSGPVDNDGNSGGGGGVVFEVEMDM